MVAKEQQWTGTIVREEHYLTQSEWGWGDAECRTRKRNNYIHRKFYTEPPPPVSNELFKVRTLNGEDVICYSSNGCLYAKEPIVLTEERYYLTLIDKLRKLIGK